MRRTCFAVPKFWNVFRSLVSLWLTNFNINGKPESCSACLDNCILVWTIFNLFFNWSKKRKLWYFYNNRPSFRTASISTATLDFSSQSAWRVFKEFFHRTMNYGVCERTSDDCLVDWRFGCWPADEKRSPTPWRAYVRELCNKLLRQKNYPEIDSEAALLWTETQNLAVISIIMRLPDVNENELIIIFTA